MPTEQGVARLLRKHRNEGRTFLSMEEIINYISPHRLNSEARQRTHVHEDPGLVSALEDVEIMLFNYGCRPTEGGYVLPPRKTKH